MSDPKRIPLTIEGMTCASCVKSVTDALESVPGVASANVNFAARAALVDLERTDLDPADLLRAVEKAGYRAAPRDDAASGHAHHAAGHDHDAGPRPWRLILAAVLTVPVVVIGMAAPAIGLHDAALANLIGLVLTIPVQFVCALPILRAAWANLRRVRAEMNVLVALGTLSAFAYSAWHALARTGAHVHFESAAAIITLVLLGRHLEECARGRAGAAIRALMDLRPRTARVIRRGAEQEMPVAELRVHDLLVVRPGEQVPADGTIAEGRTTVDESMLTGESVPVVKGPGDAMTGGTVNQDGAVRVRVTRIGADTTLARIVALVLEAQMSRAPVERLVDRVAAVFVPIVIGVALLTLAAWILAGAAFSFALTAAVSVLIIACPCALGLATPTALTVAIGRAARLGILVRDAAQLERAARVQVVAFDKTGTLTEGRPRITSLTPAPAATEEHLLRIAAALESTSLHPLARAVLDEARRRDLAIPAADDVSALPGLGIRGSVDGAIHHLGNRRLMDRLSLSIAAPAERAGASPSEESAPPDNGAHSEIHVAGPDGWLGVLGADDPLKSDAPAAVGELLRLGISPVLLTGDHRAIAERIASAAGIETVRAGLLPADKLGAIRELQASGRVTGMVGDGINDAPALAQADISFAMGGGTDVAMSAAGLTLLRSHLHLVPLAVRLSRRTLAVIRQNLFWAFGYNVLAIPLAAGLLYPLTGHLLHPIVAAAAMSFSSVSVVLNSLRLTRFGARRHS